MADDGGKEWALSGLAKEHVEKRDYHYLHNWFWAFFHMITVFLFLRNYIFMCIIPGESGRSPADKNTLKCYFPLPGREDLNCDLI